MTVARPLATEAGPGSGSAGRLRAAPTRARPAAPRGVERGEHDDVGDRAGLRPIRRVAGAKHVATVRRAERPRQLDLDEAEQRAGGGAQRLTAYRLAVSGTDGSEMVPIWAISFVHCAGFRYAWPAWTACGPRRSTG